MRASSELIIFAQVINVNPLQHTVNVMDSSGQAIGTPIYVGNNGAADALRINQTELPTLGTWGIVLMPYADDRNGTWVCSVPVGPVSAVNCGSPSNPDPYMRYLSHYSGYFSTLDQNGNNCIYFPDGSYIIVGSSTSIPEVYRNTVSGQTKTSIVINPSDRVATPSPPFNMMVSHPSGSSYLIDPSGNLTVNTASGANYEILSGSNTIKIDSSGNITVVGQSIKATTPSGGEAYLDTSGNVNVTASADVNVTGASINLLGPIVMGSASGGTASAPGPLQITTSGGSLKLGSIGTFLQLVTSAFVSLFNNHIHNGVNGPTSPPTTSMGSSELTTTLTGN